jgi:hypothetical protein
MSLIVEAGLVLSLADRRSVREERSRLSCTLDLSQRGVRDSANGTKAALDGTQRE